MKSNMMVNVEFLAGTSIEDCIAEAKNKCSLWGVAYVVFNFNGVAVSIQEDVDVKATAEKVMEALSNGFEFVIGVK